MVNATPDDLLYLVWLVSVKSTIYRCTDLLQKVGVLTKKRLKSTVLYTVRSVNYLVNKKYDVSSRPLASPHCGLY